MAKGDLSTATEDLLIRGFIDPSPEGEERPSAPSFIMLPWAPAGDWKANEGPLSLRPKGVFEIDGSRLELRTPLGVEMVAEAARDVKREQGVNV